MIGIIGLPCAGKSEVAAILSRLGVQTIEADEIGHEILAKRAVRRSLISRFGEKICNGNGQIDRRALAAIVFRDARQRRYLEQLVHPAMIRQIQRCLRAVRRPAAIVAAILFRLGLQRFCDRVWLVKSSAENRRRRALSRGWSTRELTRRSRAVRDDIKAHRHLVDEVIANDSDLRCLRRVVEKIWKEKFYACPSRKKT
ncbi:MAG: dephospho-CoA kinase [Planctomycetota bacterium]|nr:dephospho-CoA kinase [Planctomycetota bacterium]